MPFVGVSSLASALGISKGTVSKQAAAGKIPIADRDDKGNPLFDVAAVRRARDTNLNPLMRRDAEPSLPLVDQESETEDSPPERRSPSGRTPSALVEQQRLEKQLKNRRLLRQVADDEGLLVLKDVAAEESMTMARRTRDGVTALMADKSSALYAFIGQQPRTESELRVWLQEHATLAFNDTAQAIAAEDGDEFDDDRGTDDVDQSIDPVAAAAA